MAILALVETLEYPCFPVRSAFAQDSYPGRILVEAKDSANVIKICNGITGVYASRMKKISRELAMRYLFPAKSYTPTTSTWIRLRGRRYHNDIAFITVVDRDTLTVEAIVVPRVSYTSKRKKGPIPRACFSAVTANAGMALAGQVQLRNGIHVYKDECYSRSGYLTLKNLTPIHYFHREIIPTLEELEDFRACSEIPATIFESYVFKAKSALLVEGDRVKIVAGSLKNLVADVQFVNNSEVQIYIRSHDIHATIQAHHLRKEFQVGDQVIVIGGSHKDMIAWVVEVSLNSLAIIDHASKTVYLFLFFVHILLFTNFTTAQFHNLYHGCEALYVRLHYVF